MLCFFFSLEFTDDAVKKIAQVAAELNSTVENIGARFVLNNIELDLVFFDFSQYQ